jgi:mannose-6-phosphate isomerase-like protein (cupin superfamily)
MELKLQLVERTWDAGEHLRHIEEGEWLPMRGPDGAPLAGIDGKHGVRGVKGDGSYIGCDFVRMAPGARFALHVHAGDHEIYFISGGGFVHIDGADIGVTGGHVIHIPAEYPHGVWVPSDRTRPLIFAATGHPHHHVHAHDRMRHVLP